MALGAAGNTGGQVWANDMAGLLTGRWLMVREARAADKNTLSSIQLAEIRTSYDAIIAAVHVANPPVALTDRRGDQSGPGPTTCCFASTTRPTTCCASPPISPSRSTT